MASSILTLTWQADLSANCRLITAFRMVRVLGTLRSEDAEPYSMAEAKRILDILRDDELSVTFQAEQHVAWLATPALERSFLVTDELGDVLADEVDDASVWGGLKALEHFANAGLGPAQAT